MRPLSRVDVSPAVLLPERFRAVAPSASGTRFVNRVPDLSHGAGIEKRDYIAGAILSQCGRENILLRELSFRVNNQPI